MRAFVFSLIVVCASACASSATRRGGGLGGDAGPGTDAGGGGRDGAACSEGMTVCGGACVDTLTDPGNCGGCGIACLSGMHCAGGTCSTSCGEFADLCMGACTDFRIDPDNCGSCGNACPAGSNATATCEASTCGIACNTGFADCNGDPSDGCEIDTSSDLSHCGGCDVACPTPAHGSPTCESSACGFTCDTGWDDCDADATNGCEADLSSAATCGTCAMMCAAGEACVGGSCEGSGACYTGTARILVYGPGLTLGTGMLTAGTATITVADATTWSAMTTAEFGNYDVIWIDGADCSGTADAVYGTAQDTLAAWGPAVRGRSVILVGDPDHHGGAAAAQFYNNVASWLKRDGRNADGGRTSLFFNWGCAVFNSNSAGMVPGRGTPEQFTSVLGSPLTTDVTNFCAATTTAAGTGHPVLAGITTYWDCPLHGGFTTYPTDWTVITSGGTSGNGILVRDPMPCTP